MEKKKHVNGAAEGYIERKRILFLGLPFTFTVYEVKPEMLTITEGLFSSKQNDCYMYKVQDAELNRSFWEIIFGLGTITLYTGDTTHPTIYLEHIKHSCAVKDYILRVAEVARFKHRTVNTNNVGVED